MLAYASTLPIAAMSTGTSLSVAFAVTTGAEPAPRPRPPRPPPVADPAELLLQAETNTPAPPARIIKDQMRARLNTVDSKRFTGQILPVSNTAGYGRQGFAIYLLIRHLMSLY